MEQSQIFLDPTVQLFLLWLAQVIHTQMLITITNVLIFL